MIVFKYKEELSKAGKSIRRPVADIYIKGPSKEWIEFHPYIDSGADMRLIPLSLGKLIGLTINAKKIEEIGGIRSSVPVVYVQHDIQIGTKRIHAHLAWALIEKVPPLLGRANIFDEFDVTFKQKEGLILFNER